MGSVAPPTVVLALRGVLPRHSRALASPRADPLKRARLLESGPAGGGGEERLEQQPVEGDAPRHRRGVPPAVCVLDVGVGVTLPLRVGQRALLLHRAQSLAALPPQCLAK